MRILNILIFVVSLVVSGELMAKNVQDMPHDKKIVLIGASIGKAWKLPELPQRENLSGYEFGYLGVYDFDKSQLVKQVITQKDKPDMVMIKECSTYFPRDQENYKKEIKNWIQQLRAAGIKPVLVTAAPIAAPEDVVTKTKNVVKHLIGKPTWLESVATYNDWLRDYAEKEKIPLFDLEAVLRTDDKNKYMKKEYDIGDGVHLNSKAYKAIDDNFVAFLHQLN